MVLDREAIASLCHDQWSDWMVYLFSKCTMPPDGDMIIPKELVARWLRQINTSYDMLSEEEKNSDRKEADKFIRLIEETTNGRDQEEKSNNTQR